MDAAKENLLNFNMKPGFCNYKDKILSQIESFSKDKFILDLRPFVPINEREKLGDMFDYIKNYLKENL